jgi:hypothetical protein
MKLIKLNKYINDVNLYISIIFLFIALLPIFKFDYVVADNARAFLYQGSNKFDTFLNCFFHRVPFDILTGRPLVSVIGECHEAYLVNKLEDLYYLRYVSFAFICINMIYLSKIFENTDLENYKYLIGAIFLLSPGYFYMVNLGVNGLPAQLALLLSIQSFLFYKKIERKFDTNFIISGGSFVIANLIFPAFAFFSIILILVDIFLSKKIEKNTLIFSLKKILFFIFCAFIYFIIAKFLKLFLNYIFDYYTHASMQPGYKFSVNTNILQIFNKIKIFFSYKFILNEISYNDIHFKYPTLGLDLISLFIINLIIYKKVNFYNFNQGFLKFLSIFLISLVLILGSISPWLFSNSSFTTPHYFLPTFILTPLCFFLIIKNFKIKKSISFSFLFLLVIFFNISFLKTSKFMTLGDTFIKNEVKRFFYEKHYLKNSRILVITKGYLHEEALGVLMASLNDDYIKFLSNGKKFAFCPIEKKDCLVKNNDKVVINIVTNKNEFRENLRTIFVIDLTEVLAFKNAI